MSRGLDDLQRGEHTKEALLVVAAATRLRDAGLPVPPPERLPAEPELQLYRLLRRERPRDAYVLYNALLEQLLSFAAAVEHARRRAGKAWGDAPESSRGAARG